LKSVTVPVIASDSEAIPGPDLACTDTVMEKQASSATEEIAYSNHVAPGRAFGEGIAS